jgi:hypothetical protein
MTKQAKESVRFTDMGDTIGVFVPIKWKRTGGRKQIVLPDDPPPEEEKPTPLQIALARAYVWQKWIDDEKYANAKKLAQDIGMDPAVVRRVLRLGLLSPKIVAQAINGEEVDLDPNSKPAMIWM